MDTYLPKRVIEEFEDKEKVNTGNKHFTVLKLNPEQVVSQDHWERLVEPGWEFTVRFNRRKNLPATIASTKEQLLEASRKKEAQRKRLIRREKEKEDTSRESESKPLTNKEPDDDQDTIDDSELPDHSFLVEYWQEERHSRHPDHLFDRADEGTFVLDIKARDSGVKGVPAVIQEIRRVVFSKGRKHDQSIKKCDQSSNQFPLIHESDTVGNPTIRIHSMKLLNALKDTIKFIRPKEDSSDPSKFDFRDNMTTNLNAGIFVFPYKDLYHHKDDLVKYKDSKAGVRENHPPEYNEECDRHIDILIEYLYQQSSISLQEAEQLWSQPVPRTTFNAYWLLLKPGSTVFVRDGYDLNAYVIESATGGPFESGDSTRYRQYTVMLWNLDFDGNKLSRSERIVEVPLFDGERDITSLPLFPTRFHENEDEKRRELIERGKTFVNVVRAPAFREYSGPSRFHGARAVSFSFILTP